MSEDVSGYENKKRNEAEDNIYETSYHAIRDIWLREFEGEGLQKLDYSVLKQIRVLPSLIPKESEDGVEGEINKKALSFISFFIEDLSKLRFSKIVDAVINKREIENLTPIEKTLYDSLEALYDSYVEKMNVFDIGQVDLEALDDIVRESYNRKTGKLLGVSLVDLGDIMDVNGVAYRGIAKGAIVSLERDNIKPLVERGFLKLIESHEGNSGDSN
ncbi:MAG: hypothetical protein ACP6IP_08895 [Candidatus Njordarchaeia archaeon]